MTLKEQYIVSIKRPDGVSISQLEAYIEEAVECWCGSLMPPGADSEDPGGDPLFNIEKDSVFVRFFKSGTLRRQ